MHQIHPPPYERWILLEKEDLCRTFDVKKTWTKVQVTRQLFGPAIKGTTDFMSGACQGLAFFHLALGSSPVLDRKSNHCLWEDRFIFV